MNCTHTFRLGLGAALVWAALAAQCHAQFGELLKRLPDSANAVVVFNVSKILQSKLAIRENWKERHEQAYATGVAHVPPACEALVMASQIDFEFMEPMWEAAILKMNQDVSLAVIADKHGGTLETVAGQSAVHLPSDAYVISLDARTVGAMSPGNRQSVSRWLRQALSPAGASLSPYLQQAVGYSDMVGTEIIMALDLQDIVTPATVRERMQDSPTLKEYKVDEKQLSEVLASVQGITLGIRILDKPVGAIRVDFKEDISMLADFAKPLLLEVLAKRGATIEDLQDWKAEVAGNRMQIQGILSPTAMRRVFSVVELPTAAVKSTQQQQQAGNGRDDPQQKAYASQQYFHAVGDMLDDVRSRKDARTLAQYGVWFDNYARKIDRLSMVNVDDQLLDYGAYVASQLRNAATAVKGMGMRSRARQVNAVNQLGVPAPVVGGVAVGWDGAYAGVRYGRYGRYGSVANVTNAALRQQQAARTQVRVQEKTAMAGNVRTIMQDVDNVTAKVRRALTQRYQIDF